MHSVRRRVAAMFRATRRTSDACFSGISKAMWNAALRIPWCRATTITWRVVALRISPKRQQAARAATGRFAERLVALPISQLQREARVIACFRTRSTAGSDIRRAPRNCMLFGDRDSPRLSSSTAAEPLAQSRPAAPALPIEARRRKQRRTRLCGMCMTPPGTSPSLPRDQSSCIGLRTVRHTPHPPDGFLVVDMRSHRGRRQFFITLPASIYRRQFIFYSICLRISSCSIAQQMLDGRTRTHRAKRHGMAAWVTFNQAVAAFDAQSRRSTTRHSL